MTGAERRIEGGWDGTGKNRGICLFFPHPRCRCFYQQRASTAVSDPDFCESPVLISDSTVPAAAATKAEALCTSSENKCRFADISILPTCGAKNYEVVVGAKRGIVLLPGVAGCCSSRFMAAN
jgi:hypothetical protein